MAIEDVIIARAQPFVLTSKIQALIGNEVRKGCAADLSQFPVRLEADFCPIGSLGSGNSRPSASLAVPEQDLDWPKWRRFRVWISPEEPFNWTRSERFLKQLSLLLYRVGFEIAGNRHRIEVTCLCHQADIPVIQTAFASEFAHSRLMPATEPMITGLSREALHFHDFYPDPPYSHLLTTSEELHTSTLEPLLCALNDVREPATGFYQCLFQPVAADHSWHRNVEALHDLEYGMKLLSGFSSPSQYPQQSPSGDLRGTALDVDRKAHSDKPFFAAAVRIGIAGEDRFASFYLRSLATCMGLFLHGSKPLRRLSSEEYRKHFTLARQQEMILKGLTFRPGFLLNSHELTGLVHLFSTRILEERQLPLETLETLPVRNTCITRGTVIGASQFGDTKQNVCIPPDVRERATHLVASAGMGKTTVMINMFLQDIQEGKGAVFIDAHGDAVKHLLTLIPEESIDRCIYFDPGDPVWIPCWNPLHVPAGVNPYRMTDDLLSALERVSTDWGDRLAHVLRNGLIGLSYLKSATLLDLYNLVRQKSAESEVLRNQIVKLAVDDPVRKFWERDFLKDYREADLASPKHKLHKLLAGGSISLMLSQPESAIQLRPIMDEGRILLVDLSTIGSEAREVLGSLVLTLFMMAAVSRSDQDVRDRKPFSIFADEAHLFVSGDAIENIVAQARKFRISLSVAHQYLKQFKEAQVDALSTVGTTILGRLDRRDSQYFTKDLQDLVKARELVALQPHEMIARIGTDVVRFHTIPTAAQSNDQTAQRIIENSRRLYCKPADEVRRLIEERSGRRQESVSSASSDMEAFHFSAEDLAYDEF
ncbi:MAG: ATP-binding protein [Verrucomicrobia bacterium]|nr:ATP-binding protein [Verrucomicrobiota bacterium]